MENLNQAWTSSQDGLVELSIDDSLGNREYGSWMMVSRCLWGRGRGAASSLGSRDLYVVLRLADEHGWQMNQSHVSHIPDSSTAMQHPRLPCGEKGFGRHGGSWKGSHFSLSRDSYSFNASHNDDSLGNCLDFLILSKSSLDLSNSQMVGSLSGLKNPIPSLVSPITQSHEILLIPMGKSKGKEIIRDDVSLMKNKPKPLLLTSAPPNPGGMDMDAVSLHEDVVLNVKNTL